jgi:hypothetical protein
MSRVITTDLVTEAALKWATSNFRVIDKPAIIGQQAPYKSPSGDTFIFDVASVSYDHVCRVIEVKSSRADFKADNKYTKYLSLCHELFIAIPKGEVSPDEIPFRVGILYYESGSLSIHRPPQPHRFSDAYGFLHSLVFSEAFSQPVPVSPPSSPTVIEPEEKFTTFQKVFGSPFAPYLPEAKDVGLPIPEVVDEEEKLSDAPAPAAEFDDFLR